MEVYKQTPAKIKLPRSLPQNRTIQALGAVWRTSWLKDVLCFPLALDLHFLGLLPALASAAASVVLGVFLCLVPAGSAAWSMCSAGFTAGWWVARVMFSGVLQHSVVSPSTGAGASLLQRTLAMLVSLAHLDAFANLSAWTLLIVACASLTGVVSVRKRAHGNVPPPLSCVGLLRWSIARKAHVVIVVPPTCIH